MNNIRPIAIYLPQFHPIPENDQWWGKGFTEWTNVTKARPLFKGHYQPHLPADLGFYDLRVPEVREEQARLAREYGIYGFCYYHYWFNGKRILERPFQEVYESGKPDFPFMLCWANENWTRAWDGLDKEVLLEQKYSEEDDAAHIQTLIPYLRDKRYIKIEGRPVLAIYRSNLLPDAKRTTQLWREIAKKEGLDLYLCRFESFGLSGERFLSEGGFDAAVDFQPLGGAFAGFRSEAINNYEHRNIFQRIGSRTNRSFLKYFNKKKHILNTEMQWKVWDYKDYVDYIIKQPNPKYRVFPGITPGWDNYARKKTNYLIFKNSSPLVFKKWFKHIVDNFDSKNSQENLLFINAWNEWAEGNHLEPCTRWGRKYLEAVKEVLNG